MLVGKKQFLHHAETLRACLREASTDTAKNVTVWQPVAASHLSLYLLLGFKLGSAPLLLPIHSIGIDVCGADAGGKSDSLPVSYSSMISKQK